MVVKGLEELLNLEVSATRSIVLASMPKISKQIEQHCETKKSRPLPRAKC